MRVAVGLSFLFLVVTVSRGHGRTFLDIGPTFPIHEQSFLEMIQTRLQQAESSGKLKEVEAEAKKRIQKQALYPQAVSGLTTTTEDRSFVYDPTITVDGDIKDHRGVVIHPQGMRLNPLEYTSWGSPMVFIEGTDEEQVSWALTHHHNNNSIIVVVKGSPIDLSRQHKVRFYFDQGGKIVERFGIRHVPATVTQDGKRLRIDEISISKQQK